MRSHDPAVKAHSHLLRHARNSAISIAITNQRSRVVYLALPLKKVSIRLELINIVILINIYIR